MEPERETEPVDVGLVGAGGISSRHLPAYRAFPARVRLAAVCDADEGHARAVSEEFDVEYWLDFESFVREAPIDAVDITLPHHLHFPAAKAALEAGKHVLVEKPFTTSFADALELVELAESKDLTLMVGQMQRYHPPYRALKGRLEAGELGMIRHARVDAIANQEDLYAPPHWLWDGERAGGGAVIGYAVHKLDLLRYFIGDVTRVASWNRTVDERLKDAEDYSVGILEFENGAIADFFTTVSASATPYNEGFWLFGDEGTVHTLPAGDRDEGEPGHSQREGYVGTPDPLLSRNESPESRKRFDPLPADDADLPTDSAFTNEILHFAECIETGREPLSSGRDNLGTMAVIAAIYRSAGTDGARVPVDDVFADPEGGW